MCTSYVYTPIYIVYMHYIAGREINTPDKCCLQICASESHAVPQACYLCNENVAIGFKASMEAYFVGNQCWDTGAA